jgi:cytochrome c biogenesis protein CcmG, thiol:disulfide interchange protein DsbE
MKKLALCLSLAAAPVLAESAPAPAAAGTAPAPAAAAASEQGLKPGAAAPMFTLPVVNDFAGGKKWGPGKWTGTSDEAKAANKKLVIMSFFATYCEPCKKEMPELARIYEAYKDQGLGVMMVSIDKGNEQKDEVVALAKANGITFPVMHDRFQVVARRYSAERLPYMLMLDPTGNVKVVHVGYTEEMKAGLENEVRKNLGLEPLPPPVAEDDAKGKKGKKGGGKAPKAASAAKGG